MVTSYQVNYTFKLPERDETKIVIDVGVSLPNRFKGIADIRWVVGEGEATGSSNGCSYSYISSSTGCAMIGA